MQYGQSLRTAQSDEPLPIPASFHDRLAYALVADITDSERDDRIFFVLGADAHNDAPIMAEALARRLKNGPAGNPSHDLLQSERRPVRAALATLKDADLQRLADHIEVDLPSREGRPNSEPPGNAWYRLSVTREDIETAIKIREAHSEPLTFVTSGLSTTADFLANAGDAVAFPEYARTSNGPTATGQVLRGNAALTALREGFGKGAIRRIDASVDAARAELPLAGYDRSGRALDDTEEDVAFTFASNLAQSFDDAMSTTRRHVIERFSEEAGRSGRSAGGRNNESRGR